MNPDDNRNPFHGIGRGGVGPKEPGNTQAMPDAQWVEVFVGMLVAVVAFRLACKNKNFVRLLAVAMWLAMLFGLIFVVQFFSVFFKATGVLR